MRAPTRPHTAARTFGSGFALVVALSLVGQVAAAQPPLAAELLSLYEARLADERLGADVALLEGELERARAALEPRLQLRQAAFVGFTAGTGIAADLAASLSVPLSDPEAVAHASLMQRRLELAEHDRAVERSSRLFDFRRTLRLAAHFEEVAEVLDENRRKLLSLRPDWRELENVTEISYLSGQELGYLELVDALARARAELQLLMASLAADTGVSEVDLGMAGVGSPAAIETFGRESESACLDDGVAIRRAELVHQENSASSETEAGRRLPSVRLDFDADVNFDAAAFEPLRAEAQVTLQVALPAAPALAGAAPLVTVTVDPARIGQETSLSWPARTSGVEPERGGEAEDAFNRSVLAARLALRRLMASRRAAEATLLLRSLALSSIGGEPAGNSVPVPGEQTSGRHLGTEMLVAVARARLAVLDAQLDLDLATLELLHACTGTQS